MKYIYQYRNTAADFWQLSMYGTYGSMLGVCNIVFTVAMVVLLKVKWKNADTFFRVLLLLGCCIFTLIQPLIVWIRASIQASCIKEDTVIDAGEQGMQVTVGEKQNQIAWKKIKKMVKRPTMVILFADNNHGYVIPNRVLGIQKKDFISFVANKMK